MSTIPDYHVGQYKRGFWGLRSDFLAGGSQFQIAQGSMSEQSLISAENQLVRKTLMKEHFLGHQWRAQFLFVILIDDSCDRDAWWQLIMIMRMYTWPPDASKQPGPLQADQSEIGGLEATPYDPGFGSRNDRKKRVFGEEENIGTW